MKEVSMPSINVTNARKNLYKLIDEIHDSHEPLVITGKKSSAVLVSEEDWAAISETLFLTSLPGMRDSIRAGMKEPLSKCSDKIEW